jgi:hypothetical protein
MDAKRLEDLRGIAERLVGYGAMSGGAKEAVVDPLIRTIDQQQAELKEWHDAALILCEVCGGSGFDKPGTGYDSTCDCAGGYTGRYTPQQMGDKLIQQQAEIERLNKENAELHTTNARMHHDLDDAPGIQELQEEKIRDLEQEIERLNRAYEVLYRSLNHFSIGDVVVKRALGEAHRIREGKDGETHE